MAPTTSDKYLSWSTEMQDVAHDTLVNNLRNQRAIRVTLSRQIGIARAVMLYAQAVAETDPTPQNREDYENLHLTYSSLAGLFENATTRARKIMDDMADQSVALRDRVQATLDATAEEDAEEAIPAQ